MKFEMESLLPSQQILVSLGSFKILDIVAGNELAITQQQIDTKFFDLAKATLNLVGPPSS